MYLFTSMFLKFILGAVNSIFTRDRNKLILLVVFNGENLSAVVELINLVSLRPTVLCDRYESSLVFSF